MQFFAVFLPVLETNFFMVKVLKANLALDNIAVSIFVDIWVELTTTLFVNSTNISTNIEKAVLSTWHR